MKHPWLAITESAPPQFEFRRELLSRDLRRSVFALFADSIEQAEAALQPFRGKVVGAIVTHGEEFIWENRGDGIYHLALPPAMRPFLQEILAPHLSGLQRILEVSDANREQTLNLTRAAEDRTRLVREFSDMRESLLKEIAERRAAQEELQRAHDELEIRVKERTAELAQANESIQKTLSDLSRSHEALQTAEHQLRAKNAELEADLDLAREFQIALLPEHFPEFTWGGKGKSRSVRLFHFYEPSGAVGGDFFHVLHLSEEKTGIFFCDVMGHGVRSALMSAILRGLIEELKGVGPDPGRFLTEINRSIADVLRASGETMFATAFFLVADLENLVLTYANAGHPRPFHLKRSRNTLERLQFSARASGPALGIFPDTTFTTSECQLALDDVVIIHTDGIFEVADLQGEEFGEARLQQTVQSVMAAPIPTMLGRVVERARSFSAEGAFEDDVCLVAMQITGQQ